MAETETVPLKKGDFVWYVRQNEPACRPAVIVSDGIVATIPRTTPRGTVLDQMATIAYGTLNPKHVLLGNADPAPDSASEKQTHETTAAWDPNGAPGTWHLDGECAELAHPKKLK